MRSITINKMWSRRPLPNKRRRTMTVIHKKCNAEVKPDYEKAIKQGMTPGDWGFCTKCGERVDHLIMKNGEATISDEVIIQ